ncbi:GNAT family N-acetyltransferase [Paenactinomyces guangxiensis]|uniref:GNAT family N-acetyltransferase n=1 Tax=Paenactinomyces guangxiensis TaxID=1490290 RepID=A0A7W1WMV7_9BACL|nr:GNAT family N-acetyltransferase [Paenactinomyces guangxiensis]MBA4492765.1 GNAT family N-acetyltransferase [Paenactinomyces guangxiensis]MBH8590386.1 GNAT family N-acetyltransferase [Paenactinomyces guangxiensis]
MEYIFRIIKPSDAPLLKEFLYLAIYVPEGEQPPAKEITERPELSRYLENWGQPGDLGFIVELKKESKPIGAAWFRQFNKENPGYGFVAENIPELSIAVLPGYRGQGLGRDLLTRIINQARLEGYPGLSLSVSKQNPAVSLYERLDFKHVRDTGDTQVMLRDL